MWFLLWNKMKWERAAHFSPGTPKSLSISESKQCPRMLTWTQGPAQTLTSCMRAWVCHSPSLGLNFFIYGTKELVYISGPQPFWHQGQVSSPGDGSGGNASDGERWGGQTRLHLLTRCSPPAVQPGS